MATADQESKKSDETVTQPTTITTELTDAGTVTSTTDTAATTAATTAEAAAYYQQYQQYYQQYQQYPYNYDQQYYQQYYQQYQQQLLQQQQPQNATNDTVNTTQTQNAETHTDKNEEDNSKLMELDDNDNDDENIENGDNNQSSKDLMDWSHFEVAEWVETVENGQYAEYAQRFIMNEIDGKILYNITPQQLEIGLYFNKMIERLSFHGLIEKLKQNTADNNGIKSNAMKSDENDSQISHSQMPIKSISELQKAPPIKKKKKKRKIKKKIDQNTSAEQQHNDNGHGHRSATATATFLRLSAKDRMQNNKTSSQLLMDKMNKNNKRNLNEINNNGIQHKIEWKYQENKQYKDVMMSLSDSVLFEWEYTRNIWKFVNKQAFNENNFNMSVAEELCGCDCNNFVWKPKKTGSYYFGCQVADCAKSGNMKIKINVETNEANPSKKQKIR